MNFQSTFINVLHKENTSQLIDHPIFQKYLNTKRVFCSSAQFGRSLINNAHRITKSCIDI